MTSSISLFRLEHLITFHFCSQPHAKPVPQVVYVHLTSHLLCILLMSEGIMMFTNLVLKAGDRSYDSSGVSWISDIKKSSCKVKFPSWWLVGGDNAPALPCKPLTYNGKHKKTEGWWQSNTIINRHRVQINGLCKVANKRDGSHTVMFVSGYQQSQGHHFPVPPWHLQLSPDF